jgi:hypothetical protein
MRAEEILIEAMEINDMRAEEILIEAMEIYQNRHADLYTATLDELIDTYPDLPYGLLADAALRACEYYEGGGSAL